MQVANSGGADVIENEKHQDIGHVYPQCTTNSGALTSATASIAKFLHEKHSVIGHLSVRFLSFWDPHENIPKLWAETLVFGMSPIFGAIGTVNAARPGNDVRRGGFILPSSEISNDLNHLVHIPFSYHPPLKSGRDDMFFKLCKMHGVGFDVSDTAGTLFPLLDSIVSGCLSMLVVGNTRIKALEVACQTVQFILQQLGKDTTLEESEKDLYWENMTLIFKVLKAFVRHERKTNRNFCGEMGS